MSKSLEALQEIKDIRALIYEHYDECNEERAKSRDVFIRYCNHIEKELKALKDIVKTFKIKVSINKFGQCFVESNDSIYAISRSTYDLLKEVLL